MASWPEQQTKNPKSFYSYILFWRCQTNLKFEDLFGETQKKTPKSFYSFLGMPNKPKVWGRPKRKTTKFFYSPKTSFWGNQKEHHKVLLFFWGEDAIPLIHFWGDTHKKNIQISRPQSAAATSTSTSVLAARRFPSRVLGYLGSPIGFVLDLPVLALDLRRSRWLQYRTTCSPVSNPNHSF